MLKDLEEGPPRGQYGGLEVEYKRKAIGWRVGDGLSSALQKGAAPALSAERTTF